MSNKDIREQLRPKSYNKQITIRKRGRAGNTLRKSGGGLETELLKLYKIVFKF